KVDAGLVDRGAGRGGLGLGLGPGRAQRLGGAALGLERRLGLVDGGGRLVLGGADALGPLGRDPALLGERGVAVEILGGHLGLGLGAGNAGGLLGDHRLFEPGLVVHLGHAGFQGLGVGFRLGQ